jgi:hypothetical protein
MAIPFVEALASGAAIDQAEPPPWQGEAAAQRDGGLHFLDAELRPISLSTACGVSSGSGLGLTRDWAERLASAETERRQALLVQRLSPRVRVRRPDPATNEIAMDGLQEGDLLLAVDGKPVASFLAIEEATRSTPCARVTLLRGGIERSLTTRCAPISSDGTIHIVMWCGLVLQEAYRAVLERGFEPEVGGVYVSYYLFGSPAQKHRLVPKNWLVQLNDEPVPDLPGFVKLISKIRHGQSCRVKCCDLTGRVSAYTVKTDHAYWRSYEVARDGGEWVQRVIAEPE